jgi:flagellar basal body rod protein FlgG
MVFEAAQFAGQVMGVQVGFSLVNVMDPTTQVEASNLMLYERAYQAAARAISTVDQMLQTVIHMGATP